ncbi:AbrB/MazE/SpoVT family DNA-binding domain-containing protein [Geoglobus acetivorans]|uniref:AbrB/MazE/SpoVT family DNA-binding domain-containing protein n=1 Tax=Geoglobus acetivorans TaxID=565033 RepID=A0ABZ3H2A0_GEOAI
MVKLAKVKIDKFGRILIPKEIRRSLGIKEETELEIEVKDEKILITLRNHGLEKKVEELMSFLRSSAPKPFVGDEEAGEKWYSAEFSMRKIGLKE